MLQTFEPITLECTTGVRVFFCIENLRLSMCQSVHPYETIKSKTPLASSRHVPDYSETRKHIVALRQNAFSALNTNKNIESNRWSAGALIRIARTKVSVLCRHRRATLCLPFIIRTRSTAAGRAFPVLLVPQAKVFHTPPASRMGRPLMYIRCRFRTAGESSINKCPFSFRMGSGGRVRSPPPIVYTRKSIDIFQRSKGPSVSRGKVGVRFPGSRTKRQSNPSLEKASFYAP